MTSKPSAATRARRAAMLDEFKQLGRPVSVAAFERAVAGAQPMVLRAMEAEDQVALHPERLHFHIDSTIWLSLLKGGRTPANFRSKYPLPVVDGASCPEYEPYRARVLAKRSSAGEPTMANTVPEANRQGGIGYIPNDLWPEQGFEGTEDVGITTWTVVLPIMDRKTLDEILPWGTGYAMPDLWSGLPLLVYFGHEQGLNRNFLMLRCEVGSEGAALPKNAVHEAWMDLVGWFFDLLAGKSIPLMEWLDKAAETRADAVHRDASSLRRLLGVKKVAEKLTIAMDKFRALGMLPADRDTGRDTGRYPPHIIGTRLEGWWVKEQLAATGLDEARHRNVGWWAWYSDAVNGTSDGRRQPNPTEARQIERLYRQRKIGAPIIEDEVRRLLEDSCGPFGHLEDTLEEIEYWVEENPQKLPLSRAYLHRMAVGALHRMVPSSSFVGNYYVEAHLPAAAAEFLNEASRDLSILCPAMTHWVKANPDGHLGSLAQRGEAMAQAWAKRQAAEQDAVALLMAKISIN